MAASADSIDHMGMLRHRATGTVFRDDGIRPHRTGTFKLSRDPEFAAKVADIVGLYLNPSES
jgi:hypothetical protein